MEHRNHKLDIRIMTDTVHVGLTTSLTESVFVSCPLKAGNQLVRYH